MNGTIIYVGAFELPDGNAAAQRARANIQIFAALGYQVVCVGVSADVAEGKLVEHIFGATDGTTYWNRSFPASMAAWFRRVTSIDDLKPLVAAHAHDLKAIIAYDFPAVALGKLRTLAHQYGAAAIGESTEWYANAPMTSLGNIARNLDKSLRMRFQNSRMDGLIVASGYLKDYYAGRNVPLIELPTLMPDHEPKQPRANIARQAGPMRLIFAGSGFDPAVVGTDRERLKDRLDHVIEALGVAAEAGADFVLEIFGVERALYVQIVREHCRLIEGLGNKLQFRGRQPRASVISALREADFSIFLRKKTRVTLAGFPTKYGESIHHGTPVITNDAGSIARYHQEGKTGHFIEYGNAERAGAQLYSILNQDHVSVAKMAEFCEQSALFSPPQYCRATANFFTEVESKRHVLPH